MTDSAGSKPDEETASSGRSREVVVPLRVYKAVTVFSTLFSVILVVGGFMVLDTATQRTTLALSDINPLFALAGLAMIAAGSVLYAFSSRFRAPGMGNAKERSDE